MACRRLPGGSGWGCGLSRAGGTGGGNFSLVAEEEVAVELPLMAFPLLIAGLDTPFSTELVDTPSSEDAPLLLALVLVLSPELSGESAPERTEEDCDSSFSFVVSLTGAPLLRTNPPCTLSPIRIFPYRD